MEFKEILRRRRSVRKFSPQPLPDAVVDRLVDEALTAPSARNTRSTRLLIVDDPALLARMSDMRDYGSAFLKNALLAVVVLGETASCDLWRENAAIVATYFFLTLILTWAAMYLSRPKRERSQKAQ